jgi:perosamine synthetase
LDSGFVSSIGEFVTRFENELSSFTGANGVVAVVNGTAALELALHVAGVEPGDEVVIPPLSFVATANAVSHVGATPRFCDIETSSFGMDPAQLRKDLSENTSADARGARRDLHNGRRIAAIVPVHVFGHPCRATELVAIAAEFGIPLVEDAAEALGSFEGARHCGTIGRLGILSFNGNKVITTGGGGAILCSDPATAKRVRHLATTAKLPHPWRFDHDEVGFNHRMPNLNAALGCAQLARLPTLLERKRQLAEAYATAFADSPCFTFVPAPSATTSNHWLATVRLREPRPISDLEEVLTAAHSAGYLCRPAWTLLNHLPMFARYSAGALAVAEREAPRLLNLPSGPKLPFRA